MSDIIPGTEFKRSEMQIRYRVIGTGSGGSTLLFSSENYTRAEQFCWGYPAFGNVAHELRIEKIWIRKGKIRNE